MNKISEKYFMVLTSPKKTYEFQNRYFFSIPKLFQCISISICMQCLEKFNIALQLLCLKKMKGCLVIGFK